MTHQLAQHEQVDAGRSELGAVGVAKPMGPDPQLPGIVALSDKGITAKL